MFQFFKILLYLLVPLLIGLGSFQYLYGVFFEPLDKAATQPVLIEVAENLALGDVCDLLVQKNILRNTQSLCLYRQLKGSGASLVPGEYELSASMTPEQILNKLENGERYLRTVEAPQGVTIEQLDEMLASEGLLKRHEFEAIARSPDLLSRAGIAAESFEGYLSGGTYQFARPIQPVSVLWEMMERAEQEWEKKYTEQLDVLRVSRHEILTLASIIERATDNRVERRLVSSVLHNRLKEGLKLESIEALSYGIRDIEGEIDVADKSSPSPYNTFLNYGLPPGPILNPSKDSLESALFPGESKNLHYGRSESGKMIFSETAEAHEEELKG